MSLLCGATRPESGLRPAPGTITLCRSKSSPRSESCGGGCSRSGGGRDVKGVGWKVLRDRRPRGKGVERHFFAHKEASWVWLPRRRAHRKVAAEKPKAPWEAVRGRGKDRP